MKKIEDLIFEGEKCLELILERQGELIYSSHKTLKKGDIYLLGLNPGGEGFTTIRDELHKLPGKTDNAFLDMRWENGIAHYEKGQAPLQKRVDYLLTNLGFQTSEVCASNLIFITTKTANEINYGLAGYCWRFHEIILEIIKPKIILCFGISQMSSYSFLHSLYQGSEITFPSDHGKWDCKYFKTKIKNRDTAIVGVSHLSYYNIIGKENVIDWIKKIIN